MFVDFYTGLSIANLIGIAVWIGFRFILHYVENQEQINWRERANTTPRISVKRGKSVDRKNEKKRHSHRKGVGTQLPAHWISIMGLMSIIIHLIWLFLRISLSLCVVVPNICMRADKISSAMCWNIYLYDHSLPIWSAHLFRIRIIAIACAVHLPPRIPCIFESNSIFSRTNSILMDPFSTNQFNLEPRTFSRDSFHFCVCVYQKHKTQKKGVSQWKKREKISQEPKA